MTWQNDRLKYFRLINKRIELNNLKLNPVTIWELYYHQEPSYKHQDGVEYSNLMIAKERKVFNKCIQHIDDIVKNLSN